MTEARATHAAAVELGAHTLPYRQFSFERALEGIARAGFRYVGVWNDHAGAPVVPPDAGASQIAAVRRRIDAAGLIPRMAFRFPSAQPDPTSSMRRALEVCAGLGIEFLISAGPFPYVRAFTHRKRDMLYFREVQSYFAMLRELAPTAERLGVTIVMKPHSGITGTGEDLAEIVELIDHPAVRVCYDAGNIAYYEGLDPHEDVHACARYVRAVCIKDHRGERYNPEFPVPGEGDVDHARLFRILLDAGFAGPCLIERVNGQKPADEIDAALARARVSLEQALAAARS